MNLKKTEKKWYIFYTYPKTEKVIYQDLIEREYDAFLPLVKTLRVWKNGQKKMVTTPLFPSYIFVRIFEQDIYSISHFPKVVKCLSCGAKPSTISLNDIEAIKKMLSLDQGVSAETGFYKGTKVRIIYGPLAGHEGILVKQKGRNRFGIQLEKINHTVLIDISTSSLEKVNKY